MKVVNDWPFLLLRSHVGLGHDSGFQVPERLQGRLSKSTSCELHPNQASKFRRVLSMKKVTFLIAMKLGGEGLRARFISQVAIKG